MTLGIKCRECRNDLQAAVNETILCDESGILHDACD